MTTPAKLKLTIYQGTTQRVPLQRRYLPFAVTGDECSGYKNACTRAPVLPTDYTDEDYTGCSARMQIREDVGAPAVLVELTSVGGGIELAGDTLTLVFQPIDTAGKNFDTAVGHVEVIRPNGDVERHYEIAITLSQEVTL